MFDNIHFLKFYAQRQRICKKNKVQIGENEIQNISLLKSLY